MDDTKIFGPWAICEEPPNSTWRKGRSIYSVKIGARVADVSPLAPEYQATVYAHLISAAPDLLAALNDCVLVMERDLNGLAVIQPELRQARAAIAKATGAKP